MPLANVSCGVPSRLKKLCESRLIQRKATNRIAAQQIRRQEKKKKKILELKKLERSKILIPGEDIIDAGTDWQSTSKNRRARGRAH
jgi:hypothetical protein